MGIDTEPTNSIARMDAFLKQFGNLHSAVATHRLQEMRGLLEQMPRVHMESDEINVIALCGVGNDEVQHSSILAWLLNSTSNHGMGDLFFRSFVKACGFSNLNPTKGYSVHKEFTFVEATIDILVQCRSDFALFIEHKVYAPEGPCQIAREYRDLQRFGDAHNIPPAKRYAVFLAPKGNPPMSGDSTHWSVISHSALADAFSKVISAMPQGKARWFIEDWIISIREWR